MAVAAWPQAEPVVYPGQTFKLAEAGAGIVFSVTAVESQDLDGNPDNSFGTVTLDDTSECPWRGHPASASQPQRG